MVGLLEQGYTPEKQKALSEPALIASADCQNLARRSLDFAKPLQNADKQAIVASPRALDQDSGQEFFSTFAQPLAVSPLTVASARAAVAAAAVSQKLDSTIQVQQDRPAGLRKCWPAGAPGYGQKSVLRMAMAELTLIENKESVLRQGLDQVLGVLKVSCINTRMNTRLRPRMSRPGKYSRGRSYRQ